MLIVSLTPAKTVSFVCDLIADIDCAVSRVHIFPLIDDIEIDTEGNVKAFEKEHVPVNVLLLFVWINCW